ncbi:MAG: hypothetical protein M0P69_20555 [Bacteroidales bacterium]|nr:hypothetical protein [Bacteroidales bacterium]
MANANDPKGSKWRMWDLHIHSPYTFLANEYGNLSISDYVDRLVESGVQVIGLTNYFRFADNEIEEIKPLLEEKGIAVFPNLEFRTQPENKDNEEMHVHLIFSDQTPLEKIKSFLGRLKTTDDKYCSTLTEQDIASTTVSFDSLFTKLHEDKELQHLQDYLLAACPRGQGSFRPSQTDDGRGNTLAITIDQKTDVLFGNADDTDFFLDTTRYVHAEAKPVVACSDAHSTETIAQKYTWIKADKTFEGLKQILWEPKERVKILDRNPNDTKSSRISIDRISYKGSNNTEAVVPLNKDLNSIIGVRGSGKSTLLKSIAYKIDREQFDDKDGKPPYPLNDFKVYWADGEEGGGSDKSPKSIFYIPQNYLSALAYDDGEKVRERDTFLTLLLKKNVQFSNAITRYNDFVSSNKLKIEELVQELLSANESLKEGRQLLKQQGSKEEIQGEIKKKIEEIKKYKSLTDSEITDDEMKQYSESKKKVNDNKRVLLVLSQDKVILTSLIEHGADIVIASQEFSELSEERRAAINKEILSQGNKSLEALVKKELDKINVLEAKLTGEIKTDEEVVKKAKP